MGDPCLVLPGSKWIPAFAGMTSILWLSRQTCSTDHFIADVYFVALAADLFDGSLHR